MTSTNKYKKGAGEAAIEARRQKYKKKMGEAVTEKDYTQYKNNFDQTKQTKTSRMSKPLSFTHYKNIAGFYGKALANQADLSLVAKAGIDADIYRVKNKSRAAAKGD